MIDALLAIGVVIGSLLAVGAVVALICWLAMKLGE